MKWFGNYYIRTYEDAEDPLVAPIYAELAGLPRAFVLVAENDVLRDEGLTYAKTGAVRCTGKAVYRFWSCA